MALQSRFWPEGGSSQRFPFPHPHLEFLSHSFAISLTSFPATRDYSVISPEQSMSLRLTNSFVSDIIPLTLFSGKMWREFPATAMIPIDRGGGGKLGSD